MRDVQYQDDNRPAEKNLSKNHQQFQKKTPYLDTHASADPDIRSEIDALLAPYLDTQRPFTASTAKTYASSEPASIETQKTEHNRESIIDEESLIELRLFIRNEMKRQVTLWIEQNIDKIIQDALLSATPKARNAEETPNKASVK